MKEAQVQIKNRQQLLVIATIAAVGLFVGDKLILSPLTNAWGARARQITELRKQVTQGKLLVQREQSIRRRWEEMQRRTLTNNLSAAEQQLWKVIDSCAQDTRVAINAITPQWKRDTEEYMTYQCRIDAAGDLDRLSRFLHRVEREPLALKLEAIELGARDKEGQQLSLGLQVSGLVLNPPPK
jgi:hypothetical protein